MISDKTKFTIFCGMERFLEGCFPFVLAVVLWFCFYAPSEIYWAVAPPFFLFTVWLYAGAIRHVEKLRDSEKVPFPKIEIQE